MRPACASDGLAADLTPEERALEQAARSRRRELSYDDETAHGQGALDALLRSIPPEERAEGPACARGGGLARLGGGLASIGFIDAASPKVKVAYSTPGR